MKLEFKVASVDGKKTLVVNGRTLLDKRQVSEQIARLKEREAKELPAMRTKLDAKAMLARAQAAIDQQIAEAAQTRDQLEAVLKELD